MKKHFIFLILVLILLTSCTSKETNLRKNIEETFYDSFVSDLCSGDINQEDCKQLSELAKCLSKSIADYIPEQQLEEFSLNLKQNGASTTMDWYFENNPKAEDIIEADMEACMKNIIGIEV